MSEENKPQEEGKKECCSVGNDKLCAMLAYLLVGILWYFADSNMKKNDFVKFHVQQGIVLVAVSICGHIILGVTVILAMLIPLFGLVMLVLAIIGIINASKGEKKVLPFIGKFGSAINLK